MTLVRTISVAEARANLSDILGSVHETKEAVVVERNGIPYAVVISPEQFAVLPDDEALDWEVIDQVAAQNADKDPDAVLALCLLYTSPSPRDRQKSRMPSSA